jgi:predicted DNA-binding protein with PD1-like motif
MKSKVLSSNGGMRTHIVVLDSGEEAFATLTSFAIEAGIAAASVSAIGAFESATVGWFDFQTKQARKSRSANSARY